MISKILAFFLLCVSANAVINGGYIVAWDVRNAGSDTNGGGFSPTGTGTNYAVQDAAQVTYTDLVIGAATAELVSAGHPFDTTSPGNIIYIAGGAGCTAERFVVVSQAAGVATMDRSVGTTASVCAGKLGGGLATFVTMNAEQRGGDRVHVKTGTYVFTTVLNYPGSSSYTEGYGTTWFDHGTKPLLTTATDSTKLIGVAHTNGGQGTAWFHNISFSNTASVRSSALWDYNLLWQVVVSDCIFDGFSIALDASGDAGYSVIADLTMFNVEIKNGVTAINTSVNYSSENGNIWCRGCYIHDNSGTSGAVMPFYYSAISFSYSIFANNYVAVGSPGTQHHMAFVNCTFFNQTNDVIRPGGIVFLENNIFYGNGTTAIAFQASGLFGTPLGGGGHNNAFGANGLNYTVGTVAGPGEITLTANPFTSGTDFSLNSTAGGGALLKGLGYMPILTGSTTTGTVDVGAVQSTSAAPPPPPTVKGSAFVQ